MRIKLLAAATGLLAAAGLFGCNPQETTAPPELRPQTCDCQPRAATPTPPPAAETQTPERYADEEHHAYRHPSHHGMRGIYRESHEDYDEHPGGYAREEVSAYNYVSPSRSYRIGDESYGMSGSESESREAYAGNASYDGQVYGRGEGYGAYDSGVDYRAHEAPMSVNSPRALDSWSGYSDNGVYDHSGGSDLAESVISGAEDVVEAGAESGLIGLGVDLLAARWGHGHRRWGHGDWDDHHRWGHRWGDHDHDWDDHRHWGDHDHDWDDRHRHWSDHDHDWDDRHHWGDHDHDWDDRHRQWGDHDHDWDDHRRWGDHDHDWDDHRRWGDHDHDWDDRRMHTANPRSHTSW